MKTLKKCFEWFKAKANKLAASVAGAATVAAVTVSSFAAEGDFVAIQASDLDPILEGAKSNIGVIIPVGIGLFAILLGVGFLPTIIKKFKGGV